MRSTAARPSSTCSVLPYGRSPGRNEKLPCVVFTTISEPPLTRAMTPLATTCWIPCAVNCRPPPNNRMGCVTARNLAPSIRSSPSKRRGLLCQQRNRRGPEQNYRLGHNPSCDCLPTILPQPGHVGASFLRDVGTIGGCSPRAFIGTFDPTG